MKDSCCDHRVFLFWILALGSSLDLGLWLLVLSRGGIRFPCSNALANFPSMSEKGAPHRSALTRRRFLQMTGRVGLGGLVASRVVTGHAAETIVLPFPNG